MYQFINDAYKIGCLAFEHRAEKYFLKGTGIFQIGYGPFPTDYDAVLYSGIYKMYKENPEFDVKNRFVSALYELMRGDATDIVTVYLYAYRQLMAEEKKVAPFKLEESFYNDLRVVIEKNKDDLIDLKNYPAENNLKNGAYEFISKSNNTLYEEVGKKLI